MAGKSSKKHVDTLRETIKDLPDTCGLYLMKDADDKVLYIGKASSIRSRVASYFQPSARIEQSRGPWIAEMITKVRSIDYIPTESEVDAILREARLIKDIRPPYNSDLKDAKTFPYLEITTRSDFPAVYITRNPQNAKSRLFGPFTSVAELRAVVVELQKIFKFRTCRLDIKNFDDRRRFFRPCLLYSIRQCSAPCAARIEKADYRRLILEFIRFLQSKRQSVIQRLRKQMEQASAALDYETAAACRDRIKLIESLAKRGSVGQDLQPEVFAQDPSEALEKLRDILRSDQPVRIIEGFDIAHIAGSQSVGSMVQFIDGRPFRDGYRRFRIKTVSGVDDYACIREVITRRYRHALAGRELWPDMVLIDGGIGQLHAAHQALVGMNAPLPHLASIAKKEELIYIYGCDTAMPLKLPSNSPVRRLLQYVRDEAHRFAQHYHHILRKKSLLNQDTD